MIRYFRLCLDHLDIDMLIPIYTCPNVQKWFDPRTMADEAGETSPVNTVISSPRKLDYANEDTFPS